MHAVVVNQEKCPRNHPCPVVRICPTGAIIQKSWNSAPEISADDCLACGKCVTSCGYGAFRFDNAGAK